MHPHPVHHQISRVYERCPQEESDGHWDEGELSVVAVGPTLLRHLYRRGQEGPIRGGQHYAAGKTQAGIKQFSLK